MSNAATMLETQLYSSYIQTDFSDCAQAFILVLSLRPEVCSLQLRPNMLAKQDGTQHSSLQNMLENGKNKSSGYRTLSKLNTAILIALLGSSFHHILGI